MESYFNFLSDNRLTARNIHVEGTVYIKGGIILSDFVNVPEVVSEYENLPENVYIKGDLYIYSDDVYCESVFIEQIKIEKLETFPTINTINKNNCVIFEADSLYMYGILTATKDIISYSDKVLKMVRNKKIKKLKLNIQ